MKRINNLYDDICNINNIINMTDKVCGRTKNKRKVHNFELYKLEHIYNIYNRLLNKKTCIERYNIFMINDPKCRIIMAQELDDKIINHLVAEYGLVKVFESKYIDSMCATRIGKGTLYGVKLLKKYLNEIKKKYDNFYILKIDISKYFYSIDHVILKRIISDKIKDKDLLVVINKIIDSTNEEYINNKIIELKENRINYLKDLNISNKNKLIEEVESIPLYKYGKGVALGNLTSQAFGLIYLYELNHYIKEELKIKYIINYMDDFVIIHHDKDYLKNCLVKIIDKMNNDYKLDINEKKTKINSIKNGVDFLGYRFYCKNNKVILKVRNQTKKRISNYHKYHDSEEDYKKYLIMSLSSYNGILKWGSCRELYNKTIREFI